MVYQYLVQLDPKNSTPGTNFVGRTGLAPSYSDHSGMISLSGSSHQVVELKSSRMILKSLWWFLWSEVWWRIWLFQKMSRRVSQQSKSLFLKSFKHSIQLLDWNIWRSNLSYLSFPFPQDPKKLMFKFRSINRHYLFYLLILITA